MPTAPPRWLLPSLLPLLSIAMPTPPLPAQGPHPTPLPLPAIVAHRGASHDAPENTLPSFALGFARGADAIEADFHRTADGEVVCFHDHDTRRLAGVDGRVEALPLAALRQLDVGRWKAPQFTGTRMPTLAEVLALVTPGRRIFVECKSGPSIVGPLLAGLRASGVAVAQVTIIAFDPEVIAAVEREAPEYDTQWLTAWKRDPEAPGGHRPTRDEVLATARRIGADGIDVQANLEVLDAAFVDAVRAAGLALHCWTVNDPWVAQELAHRGVDSITTDRPDLIRAALERPPLRAALRAPHRPAGDDDAADRPAGVFGPAVEPGALLADAFDTTGSGSVVAWIRPERWADGVTIASVGSYAVTLDGAGVLTARSASDGVTLRHPLHLRADRGAWTHVALVLVAATADRPGEAQLHVDGRLAARGARAPRAGGDAAADATVRFGSPAATAAGLLLDDVAIAHRALADDEIAALMHRGVAAFTATGGHPRRNR